MLMFKKSNNSSSKLNVWISAKMWVLKTMQNYVYDDSNIPDGVLVQRNSLSKTQFLSKFLKDIHFFSWTTNNPVSNVGDALSVFTSLARFTVCTQWTPQIQLQVWLTCQRMVISMATEPLTNILLLLFKFFKLIPTDVKPLMEKVIHVQ